jgi:glycosyltransferase involved in cell wall biosynthesis
MQFTLIIPVYNGEATFPDTLRSIQQQDHLHFTVLVVDDASTDTSSQLAEAAGAQVLRLAHNSGPATARNHGGQQAEGEILVFTDSDVLLPKSLLTNLEATFAATGADAVQGTFSQTCPFANYFSQYKNLYNRFVLNALPDWIDTSFTSLTAVKKTAFIACGGFDPRIRTASVEDRTLGRNLCRAGFRIRMDRSLEVVHNKKLTLWGFVRNQYRRSKDLIKLLLRNRADQASPSHAPTSAETGGRFGTNSLATMARIPLAYLLVLLGLLGFAEPIFWLGAGLLFMLYLYLIAPFEWFLARRKGLGFALKGIPVNLLDALVSGLGIAHGLVDFLLLGKRY